MPKGDWTQRQQFWIVAKRDYESSADLLHVKPDSNEETLAVFSHQREAEAFLSLVTPGSGWRAEQITPGELVSVLIGPCCETKRVALDPVRVDDGATFELVSLGREDFVRGLLEEDRTAEETTIPDYVMHDFGPHGSVKQ